MNVELLMKIADRFGVPCAILAALFVLALAFIRGPLTVFFGGLGAPLKQLIAKAIDFLALAGATLGQLPGQIRAEGDATRAAVRAEGAVVREHVAAAIGGLRDRVSGAENEVVSVVLQATSARAAGARASQLPAEPAPPAAAEPMATPPPRPGPPPLPATTSTASSSSTSAPPRGSLVTLPEAGAAAHAPVPAT